MEISQWVKSIHNGEKVQGYVIGTQDEKVKICVTQPTNLGVILKEMDEVWADQFILHPDDIPALLELAKNMNDREWTLQLKEELSHWKNINDVFN